MMNSPIVNAEKIIKIPGLVDRDYCILASISGTPQRVGTLWIDSDGFEYIVNAKNHHRPSNERSLITIERGRLSATDQTTEHATDSAETTAKVMFEIASVDDRYEWQYLITYKDYELISDNQWRSVVYGTPAAIDTVGVDPYVHLTHDEFIQSCRVGDKIRGGRNSTVTSKEYRWQAENGYRITVKTDGDTQIGNRLFNRDEIFRSMTAGDIYIDTQSSWTVLEKRVFYIDTVNNFKVYGKELLVTPNVSDL
ncbi:hypothetical protein KRR23_27350 [Pseudomonas sp. CVAP|uniref:hypothetical protein n=1 Tax=Pseudomonas sp. CVAP\|nr:hypothetical protein [Pseudomonas sp. CVAP\